MQSQFTVSPGAIPPRTSSSGLQSRRQRQSQSFTFNNAFASSLPRLESSSSSAAAAASASASGSAAAAVVEPLIELQSEAEWLDPRSKLGKRPEQMAKRPLHPQPPPRRSSKRVNYGELNSSTTNNLNITNNGNGNGKDDMQHQINPSAPPDVARFAHDDFDFRGRGTWTDDKEHIVRGPFEYSTSHPGKDFRSQIIAAFNAFLDVPPESLKAITSVVGMLHEASLLVDDVQDSSELRRGFPVAHNIFGVAQTINSANYIYFAALQELVKLGNQSVIQLFAEELLNLHRGQGMDLFWRDTLTCPTEDDYLEMVGNKTGGLFRLGIKLMQAESTTNVDCVPLVNIIGLIFQIRDDYMNLSSSEYSHNKGMCEDLTEGKFSFPVIHSIRADPVDLQLINILKQKTTDVQVKRYAVSYMESKGSFDYTRQVVGTLIERARKMVAELDDENGRAAGIYKILDKMTISS